MRTSRSPITILGDRVFTTGTKAMLTMPTDGGKTHFAVALALSMAYGRSFCDWESHEAVRVLYIEGETAPDELEELVQVQRAALGIKPDEVSKNFTLIDRKSHGQIPFLNVTTHNKRVGKSGEVQQNQDLRGWTWLVSQIEKYKPQFIIFDNIACLAPAMVSCSATAWITQMVEPIILV
jgi:RecA-family ATPase